VDEVDGEGNPTGRKFIPGDCEHVRSRLDPYYGDKDKDDAEVAKDKEKFRQYMHSRYGIQDSSTGEIRMADPNDKNDLKALGEQRGWTVRKKLADGEESDAPELSGGFGTSPEDQGFQRSGSIPVDSLMFKLISYNNTLKYEMQLVTEIGLDAIVKVPPYFAILSSAKFPNVAHSHATMRYAKIFEDMFVDKWPFDKQNDYTMSGTGKSISDSLPDLSLLSLEEKEMKLLGIESDRDSTKMIEPSTPTEGPKSDLSEYYSNPKEEDNKEVGAVVEGERKRKLKDFYISDESLSRKDAFDWCPSFGESSYDDMLDAWFALTRVHTNKEIEAIKESLKKKAKEDIGEEDSDEEPESPHHVEGDEKMNEEQEEQNPDDEMNERSPGEPISDWFCTYGGPDQRAAG